MHHQETKPKQVHHNRTEKASLILYRGTSLPTDETRLSASLCVSRFRVTRSGSPGMNHAVNECIRLPMHDFTRYCELHNN